MPWNALSFQVGVLDVLVLAVVAWGWRGLLCTYVHVGLYVCLDVWLLGHKA